MAYESLFETPCVTCRTLLRWELHAVGWVLLPPVLRCLPDARRIETGRGGGGSDEAASHRADSDTVAMHFECTRRAWTCATTGARTAPPTP